MSRPQDGSDVFRSGRLVVHISPDHQDKALLPKPMPLDDLNQSLRDHLLWRWPPAGTQTKMRSL